MEQSKVAARFFLSSIILHIISVIFFIPAQLPDLPLVSVFVLLITMYLIYTLYLTLSKKLVNNDSNTSLDSHKENIRKRPITPRKIGLALGIMGIITWGSSLIILIFGSDNIKLEYLIPVAILFISGIITLLGALKSERRVSSQTNGLKK